MKMITLRNGLAVGSGVLVRVNCNIGCNTEKEYASVFTSFNLDGGSCHINKRMAYARKTCKCPKPGSQLIIGY